MARKGKNAQFELAKFTAKRDLYFSEIEELYKLSHNIGTPEGASIFLTRYTGFDDLRERFIRTMEVVNDHSFQLNPEFTPDYSLLREAERLRCSILEAVNSLKKEGVEPVPQTVAFKLPKIAPPEFDGEITRWPLFWEKFDAIIHSNPALDNLSKLHYLLGALKGRAQDVCAGFTPTAANYPILVQALKARYDNKRNLANTFLQQLLDLKPLTQESASGLSQALLRFDTAYKSLQGLGLPDLTDFIMAALLLNKLDSQTRRAFETSNHFPIPSYQEIYQFLQKQIEALSQIPKNRSTPSKLIPSNSNPPGSGWKPLVNQVCDYPDKDNRGTSKIRPCPLCGQFHQIYKCNSFLKLSPSDRLKRAQDGNWCFNCLSQSHVAKSCNSKFRCRICNRTHHTLLHIGNPSENASPALPPSVSEEKPTCNFLANFPPQSGDLPSNENVPILPTAVVYVHTPFGHKQARFLIDSGSQRHFISLACCRRFHLPLQKRSVPLEGMGSVSFQAIGLTNLTISSRHDLRNHYEISALVTERITRNLPPHPVKMKSLTFFQRLPLADPEFFRPGRIDGILGVQLFGRILSGPAVVGPDPSLYALPTELGHIVVGEAPKFNHSPGRDTDAVSTFCILDNQELHRAVQRFWEVEEVPQIPKLSREEEFCEKLYESSTCRIEGHRYCVELPFKEFPPILGDSRANAERRFYSLERKFRKNPQFFKQYAAVIQDYLDQKHLTFVSEDVASAENSFFIPHFAVIKESSSTPLRIVFDASAKTSNGRSLNDVLFTGPKLQKDISRVLMSFRTSAVALVADIRQMYRNIAVHQKHRRFQRILWRNSPQEPLQTLELNCVVFGVTSAPFLALRTVQQLASDEAHTFPLAATLARNQMYVDDLVISLDSVSTALEAYQQLVSLFRAGGFTLTKWVSNSKEVLEAIPAENRLAKSIEFSDSSKIQESVKVLGLSWDFSSDSFLFKITSFQPKFTKRGILSVVARIWDPLGFLAPVTLLAKLIIKDIWATGLHWDEELPPALRSRWQNFVDEFPRLHEIRIPRYFGLNLGHSAVLVGFADSSEKGYGAVVYLRLSSATSEVRLLLAKSRVAPQKTITLPKLELCAAVLLSEIMNVCVETLATHFPKISKIALTDSSVTLAWIKNDSIKRETFVANRISAIERNLPPEAWFHIRSENNIADEISRGLSPAQLMDHPSWICGPSWLQLEPDEWPIQAEVPVSTINLSNLAPPSFPPEKVVTVFTVSSDSEGIETFLRRFSSLNRLLRVLVYMLRFCKRLPAKSRIEPSELEFAEKIVVRQVQREHFSSDIVHLQSQKISSSKLRALSPFLDGEVLRVGGRLSRSTLPYDAKHPLLLPKESHLSKLVITDCHAANFHTGPSLVIAIVRQRFWILSVRSLARKCIRECNFCFKMRPFPTYPPMADLPAARVQEAKPFLNTGVDYAGPFQISISRRRGVRCQKAYLCLFICLATKAVHLELASSLSTETFLACFQRFVARRGPVSCLYSDRGTNFIGAKADLDAIHAFVQSDDLLNPLQNFLNYRRIEWKFNPPHAPHFGGIWEGNIRSVKMHLAKAIGTQILSYEEFNTILVQIESLLNSRPLCALSEDPAEPTALTPAHFLTLTPLQSLPLSATDSQHPLRTRKELLDSIVRSFWKKWHSEYLTTLQPRKKWFSPTEPLKIGTVVVVKHDSSPPLRWPLGIVEQVHPGADGVIRVATIRIGKNLYQRPVAKLCPLPSQ